MSDALITVLMAVRNGGPYLRTAIESILAQTYGDFEFLIMNDGSTDDTVDTIRSYRDSRIRLMTLAKNVGQTAALNRGLPEVTTKWIARMDADDYSAPDRFKTQMDAAKTDDSLGCIGTFAWFFRDDPAHREAIIVRPVRHDAIKESLLWCCPMVHSSIVVRTEAILDIGGYDERYRYSADLDLYDRLFAKYRAANVPQLLHGLRRHVGQDSYSITAIRESIQIFSCRLSKGNYSRAEAATIRSAQHLHEALCARMDRRYVNLLQNLAVAFWFSPSTTLRHFRLGPVL